MYISHFPNPGNQMSFSEETALLPFLILIIHSLCNSQINLSKQYVRSNHTLPTPTYDSVECYPPWNKTQIPYMAPVFLFLSPLTSSSSLPYSLYFNQCPFGSSLNMPILVPSWPLVLQISLPRIFFLQIKEMFTPSLHSGLCMCHSFKVIS